jgi:hypothetical protein
MREELLDMAVLLGLMLAVVVAGVIVVVATRNKYILGNDEPPRTLRKRYPKLALVADITGVLLLILVVCYFIFRK